MIYSFSISADTANSAIYSPKLVDEIAASSITVSLDRVDTDGDSINVVFTSGISASDLLILEGVVGAHDGVVPLKSAPPPTDNEGAPIIRTRAFANADNLRFRGGGGAVGTVTAGTSDTIDLLMTEDKFITGAEFIMNGQSIGDYAHFQVVDLDNLLGYGAGVVLDQFATNWWFSGDSQKQGPFSVPYPALVTTGLYLRVVYYSTGSEDVTIRVNYYLHKKP